MKCLSRVGFASTIIALLFAPALATAQRGDAAAIGPRAVRFFAAEPGSLNAPAPVDPSQVSVLRLRIAVDLDGVQLGEALRIIAQRSGLRFVYAETAIRSQEIVHLRAQDITVAAALTEVLLDASVDVIIRPGGNAVLVPSTQVQTLVGTVRDSLSRFPVPGAVLILLDSAGGTISRNLSNERGAYRIALAERARSLRVLRIGFQPRELRLPTAANRGDDFDITMHALPSMIQAVRVLANANCSARKDRQQALGLWEQARAGLLATIVARESNPAAMTRFAFNKTMLGSSDRIETMNVRVDSSAAATTSFVAAHPAQDLVRFGFSTDTLASGTYFGPDADVLLSEFFAAAYCFEIARPERTRPTQIGLRFIPADSKHGRVDIDGALWIDTVARELREIEYRYVGVQHFAEEYRPGGNISFHMMPNGAPAIDRWFIRVVSAQRDTVLSSASSRSFRVYVFAEEVGGELAHAKWGDGAIYDAPLGTARIHAVTPDGRPAAGSIVALKATPFFGVADEHGMVTIGDLVPGPYETRIIDPRIAELGFGFPASLKFEASRDSTPVLNLKVLTTEEELTRLCVANHQWKVGDSSFVFGRVRTVDGRPMERAHVTFATRNGFTDWRWSDKHFDTGTDGLFYFCDRFPLTTQLLIRVVRAGTLVLEDHYQFDSNLAIVRVQDRGAP